MKLSVYESLNHVRLGLFAIASVYICFWETVLSLSKELCYYFLPDSHFLSTWQKKEFFYGYSPYHQLSPAR
jgi:hypothetical protein